MTARTRRALLIFAALGLGATSWSAYVHYSLLTVPGYTSFCDVSSGVNCTQAYLSQYGSIWGVPVAVGGMLYFGVVLLLAGVAGRAQAAAPENVPGYVFALSTLALSFVLYLAWASLFRLHTLCVLCATTYVAVAAIFVTSGGATTFPMSSLPRRTAGDMRHLLRSPVGLTLAAAILAGTFALLNVFPRAAHAAAGAGGNAPERQDAAAAAAPALSDQQRAEFIKWYEAQPTVSVPIDHGGAKVLVVDFSDFQCPYCRDSFVGYRPIVEKYRASGQLKFVLKHYPLESECNPSVARDVHPAACEAAAAVVMAEPRGTAAKLEDWLFANQASLTPAAVREAAASVGGVPDFDAQYPRALTLVRTDAGMGALIGVKSTPTFVINGRLVAGALPPAMFEAAIEYELRR